MQLTKLAAEDKCFNVTKVKLFQLLFHFVENRLDSHLRPQSILVWSNADIKQRHIKQNIKLASGLHHESNEV